MQIHQLKTQPSCFLSIYTGIRKYTWRKDDRGYKQYDLVFLKLWFDDKKEYGKSYFLGRILDVCKVPEFGMPEDYCILALEKIEAGCDIEELKQIKKVISLEENKHGKSNK